MSVRVDPNLMKDLETFGLKDANKCMHCGKIISSARLEAVPHARLCIACKEKEELEKAGKGR